MKFLALTALLFLTACSTANGKIDLAPATISLPKLDSALLKKCNIPVALPNRTLTQEEVEHYWTIDREALVICAKRHGFLVDAIKFRDAQIEAVSPKSQKK